MESCIISLIPSTHSILIRSLKCFHFHHFIFYCIKLFHNFQSCWWQLNCLQFLANAFLLWTFFYMSLATPVHIFPWDTHLGLLYLSRDYKFQLYLVTVSKSGCSSLYPDQYCLSIAAVLPPSMQCFDPQAIWVFPIL